MSYYISILLGHMASGMLFIRSFNFIPFVILFPLVQGDLQSLLGGCYVVRKYGTLYLNSVWVRVVER